MTLDEVISALDLPLASRVDQRVPKKLLLENGAPTAADKRLINEGIEDIQWLAALKPAIVGAHEFRDATREYLEIAVIQLKLRATAKANRLIELVHRAIPYPVVLIVIGESLGLSTAHKRQALNETGKTVIDGDVVTIDLATAPEHIQQSLLEALPLAIQPRNTLYVLYQAWLDVMLAFQAALVTGSFKIFDSTSQAEARREALHAGLELQDQIESLRAAAGKASQMARQVEINLEIKRLQAALSKAKAQL